MPTLTENSGMNRGAHGLRLGQNEYGQPRLFRDHRVHRRWHNFGIGRSIPALARSTTPGR